jgi:hypothetical protein
VRSDYSTDDDSCGSFNACPSTVAAGSFSTYFLHYSWTALVRTTQFHIATLLPCDVTAPRLPLAEKVTKATVSSNKSSGGRADDQRAVHDRGLHQTAKSVFYLFMLMI